MLRGHLVSPEMFATAMPETFAYLADNASLMYRLNIEGV